MNWYRKWRLATLRRRLVVLKADDSRLRSLMNGLEEMPAHFIADSRALARDIAATQHHIDVLTGELP